MFRWFRHQKHLRFYQHRQIEHVNPPTWILKKKSAVTLLLWSLDLIMADIWSSCPRLLRVLPHRRAQCLMMSAFSCLLWLHVCLKCQFTKQGITSTCSLMLIRMLSSQQPMPLQCIVQRLSPTSCRISDSRNKRMKHKIRTFNSIIEYLITVYNNTYL